MAITGTVKAVGRFLGSRVGPGKIGPATIGAAYLLGRYGGRQISAAAQGAVLGEFGLGGVMAAGALGGWAFGRHHHRGGGAAAGGASALSTALGNMQGEISHFVQIRTDNIIEAINMSTSQVMGALTEVNKTYVMGTTNILGVLQNHGMSLDRIETNTESITSQLEEIVNTLKRNEYADREAAHEARHRAVGGGLAVGSPIMSPGGLDNSSPSFLRSLLETLGYGAAGAGGSWLYNRVANRKGGAAGPGPVKPSGAATPGGLASKPTPPRPISKQQAIATAFKGGWSGTAAEGAAKFGTSTGGFRKAVSNVNKSGLRVSNVGGIYKPVSGPGRSPTGPQPGGLAPSTPVTRTGASPRISSAGVRAPNVNYNLGMGVAGLGLGMGIAMVADPWMRKAAPTISGNQISLETIDPSSYSDDEWDALVAEGRIALAPLGGGFVYVPEGYDSSNIRVTSEGYAANRILPGDARTKDDAWVKPVTPWSPVTTNPLLQKLHGINGLRGGAGEDILLPGTGPVSMTGKAVVIKRGDTLGKIARRELGSAARWKEIADYNGIDNPNRLQIGQIIYIPGVAAAPAIGIPTPRIRPGTRDIPGIPNPRLRPNTWKAVNSFGLPSDMPSRRFSPGRGPDSRGQRRLGTSEKEDIMQRLAEFRSTRAPGRGPDMRGIASGFGPGRGPNIRGINMGAPGRGPDLRGDDAFRESQMEIAFNRRMAIHKEALARKEATGIYSETPLRLYGTGSAGGGAVGTAEYGFPLSVPESDPDKLWLDNAYEMRKDIAFGRAWWSGIKGSGGGNPINDPYFDDRFGGAGDKGLSYRLHQIMGIRGGNAGFPLSGATGTELMGGGSLEDRLTGEGRRSRDEAVAKGITDIKIEARKTYTVKAEKIIFDSKDITLGSAAISGTSMVMGGGVGAGVSSSMSSMYGGGFNTSGGISGSGTKLSSGGSWAPSKGGDAAKNEAMQFFMSKGWSAEQAAGIVGNLVVESGLNPNGPRGDGGIARGIAQWHPDRWGKASAAARAAGQDPNTLAGQLWMVQWEFDNTEKAAARQLKQTSTVEDAAAIMDSEFERSAGIHRGRRISEALQVFKTGASGTTSVTGGGGKDGQVIVDPKVTGTGEMSPKAIRASSGTPSGFIMHHTGAGMKTPDDVRRVLKERGFGVQYIMDREGNIFEAGWGPGASHMKRGQGIGEGLSNQNTVGMEIMAANDADILPVQIEAAKKFMAEYYPNVPVFGHGEVNPHKQRTEGSTVVNAIREQRALIGTTPTGIPTGPIVAPAGDSSAPVDRITPSGNTLRKGEGKGKNAKNAVVINNNVNNVSESRTKDDEPVAPRTPEIQEYFKDGTYQSGSASSLW